MPRVAAAGSQRRFCAAVTAVAALTAVLSGAWTGAAHVPRGDADWTDPLSRHARGGRGLQPRRPGRRRLPRHPPAPAGPGPGCSGSPRSDLQVDHRPRRLRRATDAEPGPRHRGSAGRRLGRAQRRSPAGRGALVRRGECGNRGTATRRRRCRDRTGRLRSRPGQPRLCHGSGPGQRRARILRHLRGGRGLARQRLLQQTRRRALVRRRLRHGQPPQHLFAVPP